MYGTEVSKATLSSQQGSASSGLAKQKLEKARSNMAEKASKAASGPEGVQKARSAAKMAGAVDDQTFSSAI